MVHVSVHGRSLDVLVTVPSADIRTLEYGTYMCPWMFHGRPSYCAIHGYRDVGEGRCTFIHIYIYIYIYIHYMECVPL